MREGAWVLGNLNTRKWNTDWAPFPFTRGQFRERAKQRWRECVRVYICVAPLCITVLKKWIEKFAILGTNWNEPKFSTWMSDEVHVRLEHTFMVSSPGIRIAWTTWTWKCKLAGCGTGSGQDVWFLGLHTWFRQREGGRTIPGSPHLNNHTWANCDAPDSTEAN